MSVKDAGEKSPRLDNFQTWMKHAYCHLWDRHAMRRGPVLAVMGGLPASGKTPLLQGWMESFQQEEAAPFKMIVLEANKGETPCQFFSRLGQTAGDIPRKRRSLYEVMQRLRNTLQIVKMELVAIDQAERLNKTILDCLRFYLYDNWKISLLLVGKPKLRGSSPQYEYFVSRIHFARGIEEFDEP
ncbi:MAG TPA: AAA family ATPase [Ktedonobacteraceae bacterium]|nr:AAA family ATPase [Ktedonobacteraceae bacterium]